MANSADENIQVQIIGAIKTVMHDKAVKGDDSEYCLVLTTDDIRQATNRVRVKDAVLESFAQAFNKAGLQSKVDHENKTVEVVAPPMLSDKNVNKLSDLIDRAAVLKEIQAREAYGLLNS